VSYSIHAIIPAPRPWVQKYHIPVRKLWPPAKTAVTSPWPSLPLKSH
jgi:hypothetical protein